MQTLEQNQLGPVKHMALMLTQGLRAKKVMQLTATRRPKLAISVDLLISVLKFAIHSRSDGFMVLLSGLQSCQPDPAPPAPAAEGDDSDTAIGNG